MVGTVRRVIPSGARPRAFSPARRRPWPAVLPPCEIPTTRRPGTSRPRPPFACRCSCRRDTELRPPRRNRQGAAGIGLAGHFRACALDGLEMPAGKQPRDAQLRELVRLVREHGHGNSPAAEPVQQVRNARIWPGFIRPAAAVLAPRQFDALGEQGRIEWLLRYYAADQGLHAVAHEMLVGRQWMPRQPQRRKGRIR